MATGMARGARARGKRIAFGDKQKIIWGPFSAEIFRGNPNIAPPGQERAPDIEWIAFYKGNRIYNRQDGNHWVWNYAFRPIPGEIYFEREPGKKRPDLIVIEPNVPQSKTKLYVSNKQWPAERYQAVADKLKASGYHVVQPWYQTVTRGVSGFPQHRLARVEQVNTASYTDALALLKTAALYIGPEGGLHHGAAAVGTRAVVMFGHFIPPQVTGYDTHINLTGGAGPACGSYSYCPQCVEAMQRITVDEVIAAAEGLLNDRAL